jgi:hypothetical protein
MREQHGGVHVIEARMREQHGGVHVLEARWLLVGRPHAARLIQSVDTHT